MATSTYRDAFRDLRNQQTVVASLLMPSEFAHERPAEVDTRGDLALALALDAEERQQGAAAASTSGRRDEAQQQGVPLSPSQVHVRVPQHRPGGSGAGDGGGGSGRSQRGSAGAADAELAAQLQDAELARQLQGVELASAVDADPSHIYSSLLLGPSTREEALSRTLSRTQSIRIQPRVLLPGYVTLPPDEPVISADRARLLERLATYDLVEKEVSGDGNCQFRALSDQLYGTTEHHGAVRASIVSALHRAADAYSGYVPGTYADYIAAMAKPGTWGDHVTLQVAADLYGNRIVVLTSFLDGPVIAIEPRRATSARTLYLSFWAEVHYNSLYPGTEPPGPDPGAGTGQPPGAHSSSDDAEPSTPKVLGSRRLGKMMRRATGKR